MTTFEQQNELEMQKVRAVAFALDGIFRKPRAVVSQQPAEDERADALDEGEMKDE